ncbi:unnamed protein product [Schistosoma mattheei]|uniref:Secreted protein n=2 Tax=Schistosoma TaxID=6181 RepID=A0A183KLG8_9TREM|nr:unnamed protein product [Schistosoma curassoni]VDP82541.1 unnamed protein product [Schistosoma mattheei]
MWRSATVSGFECFAAPATILSSAASKSALVTPTTLSSLRAADKAASLHRRAISAPDIPGHQADKRSTSSFCTTSGAS